MKKRVSKSKAVTEQILEGLEDGKTLTSICQGDDMPTIRAVQKWCRQDDELDEKILRAWIRGLRIRHDRNADKQMAILNDPSAFEPKTIQAVATITRDINHNLLAMLTRLDKRFSDKQQVENVGGPIIVSWKDAQPAAHPVAAEEKPAESTPLPDRTTEPRGGETRH